MKNKRFIYVTKIIVIILAYFVTARLGLRLNAVSTFATLVWPPTGIALAALLLLGYEFWPGVMIAAFLVNLTVGAPPLVALGISVGNTLEALLGTYLLKHVVDFHRSLERVRDVLGLLFLVAIGSTTVSATIGVSSLLIAKLVTPSAYARTWVVWWVGDMLGALVVAPLLLVWYRRPIHVSWKPKQLLEIAILTILLAGSSMLIFVSTTHGGTRPLVFAYAIFPVLIWIVLRFGQRGGVLATFAVTAVAIWGTVLHAAQDSSTVLSQNLLLLQSFIGISAITFMTMAAVVAEREATIKSRQRLIQRAALLAKQRAHLVLLNRAKDEFIGLASHQLRTPATSVKQYIGMLLDGYVGSLTTLQLKNLKVAYESNEHQIQIINDLLSVAQIESGSVLLKKEKVDIKPLIKELITRQTPVLTERSQTVKFTCKNKNCIAKVDRSKLGMALENILNNASKYSLPHHKIDIQLKRVKKFLQITIEDHGVGMTKTDMRKLFKKFSRIENPLSIDAGGTGLGLYIAQRIIKLHDGTITVTSAPNQGSTFTVSIPATRN